MTNRIADLAVLLAVCVIAFVAFAPERRPQATEVVVPSAAATQPATDKVDNEAAPEAKPRRRGPSPHRHSPGGSVHYDHPTETGVPRLPGPQTRGEFTPAMIDRCIEVARDIEPNLANRLITQREKNPEELALLLRQAGQRLLSLAELKERDPSLYDLKLVELKLDGQINGAARDLRAAIATGDETKAGNLRNQLRGFLRLQAAFALRAREDYICRLKEHIEKLESDLQYDRTHVDEYVEKRLDELLDVPPE